MFSFSLFLNSYYAVFLCSSVLKIEAVGACSCEIVGFGLTVAVP
jgi:hypothetical protein